MFFAMTIKDTNIFTRLKRENLFRFKPELLLLSETYQALGNIFFIRQ